LQPAIHEKCGLNSVVFEKALNQRVIGPQGETSMNRRHLLAMTGMAMLPGGRSAIQGQRMVTSTPDSLREQFAGTYRLAVYTPHGPNPNGRIHYDRAGYMWAMLVPRGKKPLPQNPTIEDYRDLQRGLVAYYGSYDVDESTKRVIHHVEAGSNPAWIGTDFVRWYEFSGNRLTLRVSATSQSPLIWERLPDA
jgi:hypothetical protein